MTAHPKAILIDMDDTILSYDHGVDTDRCWLESFHPHLPEHIAADEFLASVKTYARWYWSDAERHRIGRLDLQQARTDIMLAALQPHDAADTELARSIALAYGVARDREVKPFEGAIETVAALKAMGFKLALLTNGNKEPQWHKIRTFGLEPLFDLILVEGDFGIGKPDPRIYTHAVTELAASFEQTWMIGDNYEWEIAAPQRLGIRGIWIDHKGAGIPPGAVEQPFRTIRTLSDVLEMIK